jgi:hypothetical protein
MDTEKFAAGFAFYRSGRRSERLLPAEGETDLAGWIKGFCCAMADDDTEGENPTVQMALLARGIDGDLLADLVDAAEAVASGDEWCRWPSVPVRGWGGKVIGGADWPGAGDGDGGDPKPRRRAVIV